MFTGFQFMSNMEIFSNIGIEAFRYYTVDTNVLVGISSLIMIIYEILFLRNKIKEIPKYVYVLKYIGVVGVMLTFIVTAFYLSPMYGKDFILLYMNTNLFFHLVVPLLSLYSYIKYEKNKLEYKYTFITLSSVIIYAIFYITNILLHLENGKVVKEYDWYGFVIGGIYSLIIGPIIILLISYLISYIIYKLNKKNMI